MQSQQRPPGPQVSRFGHPGGATPQQMRRPIPPVPGNRVAPPPKKKKRYADKLIQPKVRELVPESQAYMDLLAFEQKLDSTITRKKMDVQEALKRPQKIKKRLRIYISHTFIAGKEPEKETDDAAVPMWELRVEGRLLDDMQQPAAGANPRPVPKRKFSSFFKSLVIELDKDIYGPDNHLVEWHRTPQTNETDGFQVKRPGDRPVKCTILLLLDYQPMKFKLHPRLAKVLGIAAETRPRIIEALWQYIKTHKLQDPQERDTINNDLFLEQCFGTPKMRFMEIPQRLHQLLQQPDPLVLNHLIQRPEDGQEKTSACYDIDVELEDPVKQQMASFVHNQNNANDIQLLDQKIFDLVDQINEMKLRRDFFVRFSNEPNSFIKKWVVSQNADLKTLTETSGDGEADRYAQVYQTSEADEGVSRYMYQKIQQKRAELEQSLGIRNN
uniref:SWIB domain-containing protein n=1 Tax=Caenorhabditis japonica TaxID=281687 RepID=A0A8R1DL80_CAEJA